MANSEERLVAEIDAELKQLIDRDPRTNKEVVEAALWEAYGGRKKSALEAKLKHKRDQLEAIEQEIQSERQDRDRVRGRIEELEAQIRQVEQTSEAYEDDLDGLLDEKESGKRAGRLLPMTLKDIAERHGKDKEDVHDDLVDRAVEQDRQIRAIEFVPPREDASTADGWVADVWGDDADE